MKGIITYQGNAQGDMADSGPDRLFAEVIRKYADAELTTWHPRTWKTNVKNHLAQAQRYGIKHLLIVAYSHGQAPTMELARLAPKYGIRTIRVCLCDPVWRNPLLPRWSWLQLLSVRSLFSGMKITVPRTIYRVDWCRQRLNKPSGHDLIAESSTKTHINPPQVIEATHAVIQHHPEWFSMVDQVIRSWKNPPKAEPV